MNLNKFSYNFEEQIDKWIELGCPLMVFCVFLSMIALSFPLIASNGSVATGYSSTLRIALSIIPSQLVFIVPILFAAGFTSKDISLAKKLGLVKWSNSYITEAIIWELCLIVPLIVFAAVTYTVCLRFGYNFISPVIYLLTKASNYGIGLVVIFAVFVAPVIEEIAFRRVLFVFITRIFGVFSSAVLTSLIFAFIHGGIVQVLPLFILSMVLQYLYLKHGTLFPSILLHSAHNFIIMILFLIFKA